MITYKQLQQLLKHDLQNASPSSHPDHPEYSLSIAHRELRKVPLHIPSKDYRLTSLDLSYNYFKDLRPLAEQPNPHLSYLNISFNFLKSIEEIGGVFLSLRVLDANANRLESVEMRDEQFPCLEALYLKNNKIKFFLHCPKNVEILCLDHNELKEVAFTGGPKLQILSACYNKVSVIELEDPSRLTFLDLEHNEMEDVKNLQAFLSKCPELLSLNMNENEVSRISHKNYMIMALTSCPKMVKVDQLIINPHVREAFKILKEEEKMEHTMKETEELYRKRMEEQLQLKQQMIQKLKRQEKQVEEKFRNYLKQEKQQLDALESYAKNNMGRKKFNIAEENIPFQSMSKSIAGQPEHSQPDSQAVLNFLVQGVIGEHRAQYEDHKKQQTNRDKDSSRKTTLRKYLGMEGKNIDDSVLSNEDEELTIEEKERRRRNMRNPSLVYRNSNELIGLMGEEQRGGEHRRGEDEETVINPRCLAYLVKNYGFHTII